MERRILPWVEKYRPHTVEEVAHQEEVIRALKNSIETGNLPHLMFHGPPGTGKTTTALALARALYGPELYRSRILELNASDDRGIAVVREKIKTFAQTVVGSQRAPGYPCPRFKLIILDEADTMTPDAQSALRRVIETYSKVTRFCLICNYVTRVIEPLASRCSKFRFKPLPNLSMIARMTHIAESESVNLEEGVLDAIITTSGGDMRRAVTTLQSCHQLCLADEKITESMVMEVSGQIPSNTVNDFWDALRTCTRFDHIRSQVEEFVAAGYPLSALISQLHDVIVDQPDLPDYKRALICEQLAQVDFRLLDGASEQLQFLELSAYLLRILNSTGSSEAF